MTITIKSNPDGVSGAIQINGNDAVVFGTQGITQGAPFSFRNKIINGKMEIAQRGTSFPAIANGAYFNDRFFWGNSTAAIVTAGQGVGPGAPFFDSGFVQVTTADASISAGDLARIIHRIEGFNIRDLFGTTFTLSFRVASAKTGIHCVSFTNSAGDRSYVVEYTVNAANTWETKSITVPGGLTTAGTWNTAAGNGLEVTWALAAGSTFQTTAGAWQTGYFAATANQVNCLDTVGNTFAITGIQLEVGSVATPFEHRPYGTELILCHRYFYKGGAAFNVNGYSPSGSTAAYFTYTVPVQMRVEPATIFTWTSGVNLASTGSRWGGDARTIEGSIVSTTAGMFSAVAIVPDCTAEL